jgi:hypothetical protein
MSEAQPREVPQQHSPTRRYSTPHGDRLNCAAAAAALGIGPDAFRQRRARGAIRLQSKPMFSGSRLGRGRGMEDTFLESDVLALPGKPETFDGIFDTPAGPRWSRDRVQDKLKVDLSDQTVRAWAESCPHLDGEPLDPELLLHPLTRRRVYTFAPADVEAIKRRLDAVDGGRLVDKAGTAWISPERACAILHLKPASRRPGPRGRHKDGPWTLWRWREEGCHFIGGEKLDGLEVPGRRGRPRVWYQEEQILRIRQAQGQGYARYGDPNDPYLSVADASAYLGCNKRTLTLWEIPGKCLHIPDGHLIPQWFSKWAGQLRPDIKGYRLLDLDAVKRVAAAFEKGTYTLPDGRRCLSPALAARRIRLSEDFIRLCFKGCPFLPEGRLKPVRAKPPLRKGQPMPFVLEADLRLLQAGVAEALAREKDEGRDRDPLAILAEWHEGRQAAERGHTPPSGSLNGGAVADATSDGPALAPSSAGEYQGHVKKQRRTGRPEDPGTAAVLKLCYDLYIVWDLSRSRVFNACEQRLGKASIGCLADVATNAKRWAGRFDPPLPLDPETAAHFRLTVSTTPPS